MGGSVNKVLSVLADYLSENVSCREMVKKIDDLVGNDEVIDLDSRLQDDFLELHESLALCVWDDQTYDQFPDIYFRESDIKLVVINFQEKAKQLIAQGDLE